MFPILKKIKPIQLAVALTCLALVFAGGFALSSTLNPSKVYYGSNPTLTTTQIDLTSQPVPTAPANFSASDMSVLQATQNANRAVADTVLPVVVRVDTERNVKPSSSDSPFQFFFNSPPFGNQDQGPDNGKNDQNNQPQYRQGGTGSGIIIDQKDTTVYVLTNDHVVDGADKCVVVTNEGHKFDAKVIGSDTNRDIAIISFVSRDKMSLAKLGDSDNVRPGDIVFAVGSPYGIQNTITHGIVSAVHRTSSDLPEANRDSSGAVKSFTDYIQTDASINPGNSGGALVNLDGEVVGMNTWIASQTGSSVGLGFSVPINNAKKVAIDFITKGKVEYGWLGIKTGNIIDENRDAMKIAKDQTGAMAYSIGVGSPADKSGILPGDIITSVNGVAIKNADDLIRNVAGLEVGKQVIIKIIRSGAEKDLNVSLGLRDEKADISYWPGFSVMSMTDDLRSQLQESNGGRTAVKGKTNIPNGALVVVNVDDPSNASEAGLRVGDQITALNGQDIKNPGDFYATLLRTATAKGLQVTVQRNGREVTLSWQR